MPRPPVAIRIEGIQDLRKGIQKLDQSAWDSGKGELQSIHMRAWKMVLQKATPHMPVITGRFAKGYRVARSTTGARIFNNVVYAGVNEFGGTVQWKPKSGDFARVPMSGATMVTGGDAIRSLGPHKIQVKPSKFREGSYFIYPVIDNEREQIIDFYAEEFKKLFSKYGLK